MQTARVEAEKMTDILRDELDKGQRAAAEASCEEAATHQAAVARLTAEQEKMQVRRL